jgi:transposase
MEALRTHVAGVDVHKEMLAITVLTGDRESEPKVEQFECSTFTEELMKCGIKLKEMGVKDVVMESTGVYWKPIYNVWAPLGLNLTIAQAAHVKNVPGRKTDMNDSHWLAQLHRFGLVRASFIPDEIFQRMRLLARHRTNLTDDLSRVKNRVERVLQDGNVKWSTVVSDTFGKAGLAVLSLLAQGVINAGQLAAAVTTKIKRKDDVEKALTNCFTIDHVFVIKELMDQYHYLNSRIKEVEKELREKAAPYRHLIEKLDEIPGIDEVLAIGILAEATSDMKHFADERAFAAWAGVAAGNNESAGKKKRSKCRPGNPHLRKILIQAAHGAKMKRGTFYRAKYNKLVFRLGSANKAKVAIANRLARAIYLILGGDRYRELGYMRGDPHEQKIQKLVGQLRALGVDIKHVNHQMIVSNRKITVEKTGIVLD